jgi:hypothetical protein
MGTKPASAEAMGRVEQIVRMNERWHEREKAEDAIALTVACPVCRAEPGDRCRSTGLTRNVKTYVHQPRKRYAGVMPNRIDLPLPPLPREKPRPAVPDYLEAT